MSPSNQTNDNFVQLFFGMANLLGYTITLALGLLLIICCASLSQKQHSSPNRNTISNQQIATNIEIQIQTSKKVLHPISHIELPQPAKKTVGATTPLFEIREMSPVPGTRKVPSKSKTTNPPEIEKSEPLNSETISDQVPSSEHYNVETCTSTPLPLEETSENLNASPTDSFVKDWVLKHIKSDPAGFPSVQDWARYFKEYGNILPLDTLYNIEESLKTRGYGREFVRGYMNEVLAAYIDSSRRRIMR